MSVIYRTSPHGAPAESGVIVVHCSDPRYQWHFHEFLRHGLGVREYGLVAAPGGPQLLARLDLLPKFSWVGWRWLKFLVDLSRPGFASPAPGSPSLAGAPASRSAPAFAEAPAGRHSLGGGWPAWPGPRAAQPARPVRVILINHEDCRWYISLLQAKDPSRVRERQLADLRTIQREFSDRFTAQVEAYYARMEDGAAVFERINP